MVFLIIQLIWVASAIFNALEEYHWSFPFRETYFAESEHHSKKAHFWGAAHILLLAIASTVYLGFTLHFLTLLLIYWLVFDAVYSYKVKGSFFYIGKTATIDKLLRRILGENAGVIKAATVLLSILLINFL